MSLKLIKLIIELLNVIPITAHY